LETPETDAVGTGYVLVAASSAVTCCWAYVTPEEAAPPVDEPPLADEPADELLPELLVEQPATAAEAATASTHGASHFLPGFILMTPSPHHGATVGPMNE
jgi:hypothetical protein